MFNKIVLGLTAIAATAALPSAADAHGYRYRAPRYYGAPVYYAPPPVYYAPRRVYYAPRPVYYDNGYYGRGYDSYYDRGYSRYDDGRYYGRTRYRGRCGSGTTGAIIGGAGGALIGRSIARGGSYYRRGSGTTGAIVGGAVGALLGREIGRSC